MPRRAPSFACLSLLPLAFAGCPSDTGIEATRIPAGTWYLAAQLPEQYQEGSSFLESLGDGRVRYARKRTRECWLSQEDGTVEIRGEDFTFRVDSLWGDPEGDSCDLVGPTFRPSGKLRSGRIAFPTDSTLVFCLGTPVPCMGGSGPFPEFVRPKVRE